MSFNICNVSRIYTIDERSWLKFRMFTWLNFQVWTQNCSTASVRLVACQSSAVPRLSTKIKTAPVSNHMCTKKCSSQQFLQPKKTNSNFCFVNKKGWWLMICIKKLESLQKVRFCWEKNCYKTQHHLVSKSKMIDSWMFQSSLVHRNFRNRLTFIFSLSGIVSPQSFSLNFFQCKCLPEHCRHPRHPGHTGS